jgi:hypothetical protein
VVGQYELTVCRLCATGFKGTKGVSIEELR